MKRVWQGFLLALLAIFCGLMLGGWDVWMLHLARWLYR